MAPFLTSQSMHIGARRMVVWLAFGMALCVQRSSALQLPIGQGSPLEFESEIRLSTGNHPVGVAVGDLNGDGLGDVVTTNCPSITAHSVSVMIGRGHGLFADQVTYELGASLGSVDIADVNGDGARDLVISSYSPAGIFVLPNTGNGSFGTPVFSPCSPCAVAAIGDVDGDGDLDLVVVGYAWVSVMTNSGGGRFTIGEHDWAGALGGVALADIDLDNDLDMLVSDGQGSVSIWLNDGHGRFLAHGSAATGMDAIGIACQDFDGDGLPDIISLEWLVDTLSFLHNNGNGQFAPRQLLPVGMFGQSMDMQDLDGDGKLDIVMLRSNTHEVVVFKNLGGGMLAQPASYVAGPQPTAAALGDVDGDGRPDMAVVSYGSPGVTLLRNAGNGTFAGLPVQPAGGHPFIVRAIDLDHDGDLDLVTLNKVPATLGVLMNRGDGTFDPPVTYPTGMEPTSLESADLDHDGDPDFVVTCRDSNSIDVFLNQGTGVLAHLSFDAGPSPGALALGDVDGDGAVDAVVTNDWYGHSMGILRGVGDGTFNAPLVQSPAFHAHTLVMADLDGDGDLDLALEGSYPSGIHILSNDGLGTFSAVIDVQLAGYFPLLGCADIDGDGHPDLILADGNGNTIRVVNNTGNGVFDFGRQQSCTVGTAPSAAVVRDFDGDGRLDVAVLSGTDGVVSMLMGMDDGTLAPKFHIPTGYALGLTAGDVDGDGDIDVMTAIDPLEGVVVHRNVSTSGQAFCLGDGTGTACPCGNSSTGTKQAGCRNSLGNGGRLTGQGSARIYSDNLVLTCELVPSSTAVFLQSLGVAAGGNGVQFADGLRCVGAPVIRLAVRTVVSGTASIPAPNAPALALDGGIHVPGEVHYQAWYRDPAAFCTSATSNLTNGWTVRWTP